MSKYVVLVRDDEAGTEWWKKGEYQAADPDDALAQAWAGTFHTPRLVGFPVRRYRCAVVGPEIGWAEYDVSVEAQPSTITVALATKDSR